MNTKQVILPFFGPCPHFLCIAFFFYVLNEKIPRVPQKAPRGFLSFNCNNSTFQHSTFNTQHSTLLRANFLAILDVYALLHSLSYAAAVQVVNGSIAWLLIQCYRMDAGRLQILYHIIKVYNPVLGILMSLILCLAARIEMQRTDTTDCSYWQIHTSLSSKEPPYDAYIHPSIRSRN